jgi:hypothetical protein
MDEQVDKLLRQMGLAVFRDPDMPFVSAKSASWGDANFHRLVCTKLFPVLRALRLGLSVVLSDADIAVRRDPAPYIDVRRKQRRPPPPSKRTRADEDEVDIMFSIGSCHKDLPDNLDIASDPVAKLNTGFYAVSLTSDFNHDPHDAAVLDLFERALTRCSQSAQLHELEGDQPAMNMELNRGRSSDTDKRRPRYGFFDGCLFANGCVAFKHLCANSSSLDPKSSAAILLLKRGGKLPNYKIGQNAIPGDSYAFRRDDMVLVHANFVIGKKEKVRHLQKMQLWDTQCIASLKEKH